MAISIPPGAAALIDFTGAERSPRILSCKGRLRYGAIAVGRCTLRRNPGTPSGAKQLSVIVHDSAPVKMEWRSPETGRQEYRRIAPGDIHIIPASQPVFKRWDAEPKILFIAAEPEFVEHVASEAFETHGCKLTTRIGIRDPVISGMAAAWRQELAEGGATGRLYTESLATALIIHLYHAHTNTKARFRPVTGGLGASRQRRVIDYIEAHLTEDIGLADLAATAGLSAHHFSEAFKASMGQPPCRYLIERRLLLAKEMLLMTNHSITEIAFEVGFSSHSHFTFNFRRAVGVTPSQFRQDRL